MRIFASIDNGVSGSIAIVSDDHSIVEYFPTPIKRCLNYTKTKQFLNRVDVVKLKDILILYRGVIETLLLERPMLNPGRFKASVSALRALEATLIVLEELGLPYSYCDSKSWQKIMLPSGLHKEELKIASLDVAKRIFPSMANKLKKDGDSLLMAEYARRLYSKSV